MFVFFSTIFVSSVASTVFLAVYRETCGLVVKDAWSWCRRLPVRIVVWPAADWKTVYQPSRKRGTFFKFGKDKDETNIGVYMQFVLSLTSMCLLALQFLCHRYRGSLQRKLSLD